MNRYPGIRPFRTDERHLFFGRSDDIERLYRLLRVEQFVVLYGKSGYGKSSLLSAGIYPKLSDEDRYMFWEVRFGPYQAGESATPADTVRSVIQKMKGAPQQPSSTIWQAVKNRQTSERRRFILFFDQFEELFSYPPAQVAEFKQQLAEALFAPLPTYAAAAARNLNTEAEELLYEPFELKVLCSIRSDRISLLKQLEDYLPNLLRHAFELNALDEKQATEAIVSPAALNLPAGSAEKYDTPPFQYTPETLTAIFQELSDDNGRIETSALQIVCKHVEYNIVSPKVKAAGGHETPGSLTVTAADLGDFKTVFRTFYDQTIASLEEPQRPTARRLVEDLLIKDNIRLPFAEQALLTQPGVNMGLLETLEKSSLLRVELDGQRRRIYEIGHDTLVAPIAEAAQARRDEEERQARLEAGEQQRLAIEKAVKARRKAWLVATGAVTLALVAISALAWALWQQAALRKTTARVVDSILEDASEQIRHLQYDAAWEKMRNAGLLGEARDKTGRSLMEVAFYYAETGNAPKALEATRQAADLFDKSQLATNVPSDQNAEKTRMALRNVLQSLDPMRFSELEARYYPVMLKVSGGTFWMGRDVTYDQAGDPDELPRHQVHLANFEIAQTETTFWQYGLYAQATGLSITGIAPEWGIEGDNPVVRVSWLDACRYANWLSKQFGRDTAYIQSGYGVYQLQPASKGAFVLPTEAEWEYAARGGTQQSSTLYAGSDSLNQVAWHLGNSNEMGQARSHPVKTKAPNALQLFDMTGNVWEWCWDWYGPYSASGTPAEQPYGPEKGVAKVMRGSSWNSFTAQHLSNRNSLNPDDRSNEYGIRLGRR